MTPSTRSSTFMYGRIDPGPEPFFGSMSQDSDVEMTVEGDESERIDNHEMDYEMEHDPVSNIKADRLVIAIDFGTTFSSVAYAVLPKGVPPERVDLRHVKCIGNYPGYEPPEGVQDFRQDVPTELWYDDGLTGSWRQRSTNGFDDDTQDSEDENGYASSDEEGSDNQESRSQFDDDNEIDGLADTQSRAGPTNKADRYWGYGVQQKLNGMNAPRDEARPLTRFKLLLVDKSDTREIRAELQASLGALRKRGIIKRDTDIYTHYLEHLLQHTKDQLLFSNELQQDTLIQFVLCVPAKWPVNACRIMQAALEQAVEHVSLSKKADADVCNLFIISEPEAAAECILAEAGSELYNNETVVVLDAGGGTVDAVTYKCVNGDPVRLAAEVVAPDSKLCGASFINERYEKKLLQKLASETYLVEEPYNTKTLKSIVQVRTNIFENYQKRIIDTTKRKEEIFRVRIENLRENRKKGFFPDNLELKRKTMKNFFEPSLRNAREVLENQLDLAENKDRRVEKVILTGGFGQSPSLQSYLRMYLAQRANIKGRNIDLIVPQNPSTAVARGAVLRALNKRFGPSRITQCSYGFILSEPYEPEEVEAHSRTNCRINKVDGERYVDGTIRWVLRAGQRVENMQAFTFDVKHTFSLTRKELVCAEQIWMSDGEHPNHYRKTHALNKGAVMVGFLEAKLTRLRDEGRIEPQEPSEFSTHAGSQKKYWEVHYEIALIVEGRSIRFEARYPVKDNLRPGQQQEVLGVKLVGIAAAFAPGTA